MRKLFYAIASFGVLSLSGCALNQMVKMAEDQNLTVTPNPLEVHADTVAFEMSANLPVKMLKKGKVYSVNTYYTYGGNETALDPVGELVMVLLVVVPSVEKQDGSFIANVSYDPPHRLVDRSNRLVQSPFLRVLLVSLAGFLDHLPQVVELAACSWVVLVGIRHPYQDHAPCHLVSEIYALAQVASEHAH